MTHFLVMKMFLLILAGLLFFNENLWFGGTFKHMTSPNISFESEGGQVKLEKFYSIHGGYKLPLNTRYVLMTSIYILI